MKAWLVSPLLLLSFICSLSIGSVSAFAQIDTQSTPAPSAKIKESLRAFEAKYAVYRSDNDIGEAKLKLSRIKSDQYQLAYQSKVSRFFLSDNRYENTTFITQNNSLVPQTYAYKRTGTGPNKALNVVFDAPEKRIIIDKKDDLDWTGEFDNQLFRVDLPYKLSQGITSTSYDFINYRGQKRHYQLELVDSENLSLPYGQIMALKVAIKRESSSRATYAWFAPSLNYNLVRLQQFKDEKEQGDMQLTQFTYL